VHAEQRLQRIQQAISEARSATETTQPEDVIRKLEEDIQIHSYLANEKLPKEIEAKRSIVQDLGKVSSQPAMDQSDIAEIKKLVQCYLVETLSVLIVVSDGRNERRNCAIDR
jgi:hypothetical protein